MSNWRAVEAVQACSGASGAAFDVLLTIAALSNRHDDGWTFASRDRIALLARRDRRTVLDAIEDLLELQELEYEPGSPSLAGRPAVRARYRVRIETFAGRRDRFRCKLTGGPTPPVTGGPTPPVVRDSKGMANAMTGGLPSEDRWSQTTATGGPTPPPPVVPDHRSLLTDGQMPTDTLNRSTLRVAPLADAPGARGDDQLKRVDDEQKPLTRGEAMSAALEDERRRRGQSGPQRVGAAFNGIDVELLRRASRGQLHVDVDKETADGFVQQAPDASGGSADG